MRGSDRHNRIVERLRDVCLEHGAWVRTEAHLGFGSADLIAGSGDRLLLCEVELTPDRVHRDVTKAGALNADLLIVTPNARTARAVRRRLRRLNLDNPHSPHDPHGTNGPRIRVLAQGPAIEALRRYLT